MCKQKINETVKCGFSDTHYQQGGFSLVMVMMIMVVIALLVIAGAQVSNTEMRISTNNADQKYAKGLAERALLEGEKRVTTETLQSTGAAITPTSGSPSPTHLGSGSTSSAVQAKDESELLMLFPANCKDGLCGYDSSRTVPIWEDDKAWTDDKDSKSFATNLVSGGGKQPRYIVEYLGTKDVDGDTNLRVFRVTARAWGENENTISTLQSVIVAPSS